MALAPNTSTQEFDGTTWTSVPSTSLPQSGSIAAYDANRQRTILVNLWTGWTWEWDGVNWQQVAPAPVTAPYIDFGLVTYDESRQRVIFLKAGVNYSFGIELYEWNGVAWTLVPTANAPLTGPNLWGSYAYHALAYDKRLQKLVLFGRSEYSGSSTIVRTALTWEWDATAGWVAFPASGVIGSGTEMWFDEGRGVLLRNDGVNGPTPHHVNIRTSSGSWTPMPFTGTPFMIGGCYDSRRSRFYSSGSGIVGFFSDTYPATYTTHGSSCPVLTPPTLGLTAPWTRAWQGSVLSLDANSLPLSIGILAMGFTDQSFGPTPLPLDLTSYGMPLCHLRVAPEATMFATGSNGTATFQIPIPSSGLIGVSFWQQVFAPAPAANPAGMLASNSMQGVVGRSQ